MLQILKSFLENIGEGRLVLKEEKKNKHFNATDTRREKLLSLI